MSSADEAVVENENAPRNRSKDVTKWKRYKAKGKGDIQASVGLLWCYGEGKFRVRVRIRVRFGVRVVNMFGVKVMLRVNTTPTLHCKSGYFHYCIKIRRSPAKSGDLEAMR